MDAPEADQSVDRAETFRSGMFRPRKFRAGQAGRAGQQMNRFVRRLWWSCRLWNHFGCVDLSAAFAYHTLQSIFPILLIILALASWILGRDDGLTSQILDWTSQLLPESAQRVVQSTLIQLYRQRGGAGFLGVAVLLITASNAYLSLQRGTDHLWSLQYVREPRDRVVEVQLPVLQNVSRAVRRFLMLRLKASLFLVAVGTLFVMDQLTINLRLMGFETWRGLTAAPLAWVYRYLFPVSALADLLASLVLASLVALGLLQLLPSRRIRWQFLLPGSVLMGFAYTLLNLVVGRSIVSLGARFQAYGLIGGVLVLTLWVWLLGLIYYFGVSYSVILATPGSRTAERFDLTLGLIQPLATDAELQRSPPSAIFGDPHPPVLGDSPGLGDDGKS